MKTTKFTFARACRGTENATPVAIFSWKLTRHPVTVGGARDVYVVFLLLRQGANLLDLAPVQTGIVMEETLAAANGQIVLLEVLQLLQVVVIDDRHTVPVATPAKEKCKENSVNISGTRDNFSRSKRTVCRGACRPRSRGAGCLGTTAK